jgi:hypothetical protein
MHEVLEREFFSFFLALSRSGWHIVYSFDSLGSFKYDVCEQQSFVKDLIY